MRKSLSGGVGAANIVRNRHAAKRKRKLHRKGAFQNLSLIHGLRRAGGNTNLKVCLRDAVEKNCVVKWEKVYSS
jgi:hypothetical protein